MLDVCFVAGGQETERLPKLILQVAECIEPVTTKYSTHEIWVIIIQYLFSINLHH